MKLHKRTQKRIKKTKRNAKRMNQMNNVKFYNLYVETTLIVFFLYLKRTRIQIPCAQLLEMKKRGKNNMV